MKKVLLCAAFIAASFTGIAQVGVGTTTQDASAALEVKSTNKGFLPPRMSTIQRDDISTPATGLVIYNTTRDCVQFFNGDFWFDTCTQTTENPNLTVASPTYQGTSVISNYGIGYNGEAVPSASTITVQLTNNAVTEQSYTLSATDNGGLGLIYAASGTIDAGVTIAVILIPNTTVLPDFVSGPLVMPLLGTNSNLILRPRIDIKSIPESTTQVTDVVYGTQTWMDRNLGARRVATAIDDVFSYGNYYQWGRPADGHEITVWHGKTKKAGRGLAVVTATLATDANPSYANFITTDSSPFDWLANPATSGTATLWATANQGPCPYNYHVPSSTEWETADATDLGWQNNTDTYNSPLKLPSSGRRDRTDGSLFNQGTFGGYWSSTVNNTNARRLTFTDSTALMGNNNRAQGFTVRCLKDD